MKTPNGLLLSGLAVSILCAACGGEKEPPAAAPVKSLGAAVEKPKPVVEAAKPAEEAASALAAKLAKAIERTKDGFDRAELYAKAKGLGAAGKGLISVLQKGLTDAEPIARAAALEAIAAIDMNALGGSLVTALADREAEVRMRALAIMDQQPAFDADLFFKAAGDEIDSTVQLAAMKILEKRATATHGEKLVKLLGALDPKAAAPGIQLVAKLGLKQAAGRVAEFVNCHDEEARVAAADGLATLGVGEKEQLKALVRALEDDSSRVRKAAYSALKKLSGKDIPYKPDGDDMDREDAVKAWKEAVLGK